MIPFDVLELAKEREQANSLNGLSKTHFISEDAIQASLIETDHPVDTVKLVISEDTSPHNRWLHLESGYHLFATFFLKVIHICFSTTARLLLMSLGHGRFPPNSTGGWCTLSRFNFLYLLPDSGIILALLSILQNEVSEYL